MTHPRNLITSCILERGTCKHRSIRDKTCCAPIMKKLKLSWTSRGSCSSSRLLLVVPPTAYHSTRFLHTLRCRFHHRVCTSSYLTPHFRYRLLPWRHFRWLFHLQQNDSCTTCNSFSSQRKKGVTKQGAEEYENANLRLHGDIILVIVVIVVVIVRITRTVRIH